MHCTSEIDLLIAIITFCLLFHTFTHVFIDMKMDTQ